MGFPRRQREITALFHAARESGYNVLGELLNCERLISNIK